MKNKKIIALIVSFMLVAAWGIRFIYLNSTAEKPVIEIYNQGEFVDYGDNFFFRSSTEQRNGYSIKVVSAKLMKIEDFLDEIGLPYSEYQNMVKELSGFEKKYVVDLNVIIKNTNNSAGNFDRLDTRINTSNLCLSCDDVLFDYMYPELQDSYAFKVRENTEYEMHIPYCPEPSDEKACDWQFLTTKDFYLNISQYPVKKMIKLQIEPIE